MIEGGHKLEMKGKNAEVIMIEKAKSFLGLSSESPFSNSDPKEK